MGTDLVAIISAVSSQLPKACVEQGETAEQTIILKNVAVVLASGWGWEECHSLLPSCRALDVCIHWCLVCYANTG